MSTAPLASGYTPDDDLKLHSENAINLICKPFQSHESGLPEWPKNAADEYKRSHAPESERVIVLLLQNGRSGGPPTAIGCLDFSGMTSTVIDNEFRHWADPDASKRGDDDAEVQGGHGNGGKCYMVQMFDDRAYLHTVKDGRGCIYGTVAGSIHLGYFPNREEGKDFLVSDVAAELARALSEIGVAMADLPPEALEALRERQGFTLVVGRGAKGYSSRIPATQILESLIDHPQMRTTLEMCSVFALVNGKAADGGKALELPQIPPMAGAETPRVIAIPERLVDPVSDEDVSTTAHGQEPPGTLTLHTSETRMWRGAKKSRHNVVYKAKTGYIGYKPVNGFGVSSAYRERIYGDCVLMALEPAKLNDRAALAPSPLVRAVESWIGDEIEAYAREFEARDRRKHDQEEKDALAQMNAALDSWKNQLLDRVLGDEDAGDGDGRGPREPPTPLPTGIPARIELSLSYYRAGVGIALRPALNAFDASGDRIRPPAVTWTSSDPSVALVDEDIRVLNTLKAGETVLQCETFDKSVVSNTVTLDVVDIASIDVEPTTVEVPAGSRRRLTANCTLVGGEIASDVALVWIENDPSIASVSAAGMVFGFAEGVTEVTASDDNASANNSVVVEVGPGDSGDGTGSSYPRVLISEIQLDPDTLEEVVLSSDDPPVHQRVEDVERNIWWINSASPLARIYLSGDFGPESREWRIYHLERYVEVIAKIAMTQGPDAEDVLGVDEWAARWGERAATIQEAAAAGLASFIHDGELPS
jgi:Bacterial Ig-like domain (group 2)